MNSDPKEQTMGGHDWPPILEALSAIPDPLSKWTPYILSDPPPKKEGEVWHKTQIVVHPPPKPRIL